MVMVDSWTMGSDPWSAAAGHSVSAAKETSQEPADTVVQHDISQSIMVAAVHARASRQQIAALGAALWRLEKEAQTCSDEKLEVRLRLDAMEPCIRAQVQSAACGKPSPSSAPLVHRDLHVMSTAAKHIFPEGSFAAITPTTARRLQRGQRKHRSEKGAFEEVLEDAPTFPSERILSADDSRHGSGKDPARTSDPSSQIASMADFAAFVAANTRQFKLTIQAIQDMIMQGQEKGLNDFRGLVAELTDDIVTKFEAKLARTTAEIDAKLSDMDSKTMLMEAENTKALDTMKMEVEQTSRNVDATSVLKEITRPSTRNCNDLPRRPSLLPLCKFHLQGRCSRGDACTFSHAEPAWSADEPVEQAPRVFEHMLRQAEEDGFPDAFVGHFVTIVDLVSASELNGVVGKVTSVDFGKGRCGITLQSRALKSIKFGNLLFPARCLVCTSELCDFQTCHCLDGASPSKLPD